MRRLFWISVATGLFVIATGLSRAQAPGSDKTVTCRHITISVVASGKPVSYGGREELCATRDELLKKTTIQLLIQAGMHNHSYANFALIDGIQYLYVRDVGDSQPSQYRCRLGRR
jgi:hypothetical protein